ILLRVAAEMQHGAPHIQRNRQANYPTGRLAMLADEEKRRDPIERQPGEGRQSVADGYLPRPLPVGKDPLLEEPEQPVTAMKGEVDPGRRRPIVIDEHEHDHERARQALVDIDRIPEQHSYTFDNNQGNAFRTVTPARPKDA